MMATRTTMRSLLVLTVLTLFKTTQGEVIESRHNLGYTLTAKGRYYLQTGKAQLMFTYELPRVPRDAKWNSVNCTTVEHERVNKMCWSAKPLLDSLHELQIQAYVHIQRALSRVYDALNDVVPKPSKKRGFLTDMISKITGLARTEDVQRLTDLLSSVGSDLQRTATIWQTGSSHFLAAIKTERSRIDNVMSLLSLQKSSMETIQEELNDERQSILTGNAIMIKVVRLQRDLTFQMSEIEALYTGVEILMSGHLSQYFVSHSQFEKALRDLHRSLQHRPSRLKLLFRDTAFYYREAKFRIFRMNTSLIINVDVPLTALQLTHGLTAYRLQKIPLVSPGSDQYYTELATPIKMILFGPQCSYLLTLSELHDLPQGQLIDLRTSQLILQRRNSNTCAESLIRANLPSIKRWCRYHIVHAPLPRSLIKIGANTLLLSNIKTLSIFCEGKKTVRKNITELQHVITVHCGCVVTADEFTAYDLNVQCHILDSSYNISTKFVLNLPFLSELVHANSLNMFRSDSLLDSHIPDNIPELAISSKNYSVKLGIEKQARFDMAEIINSSQSDTQVFPSLSHYLAKVVASHSYNDDFDILSVWSWMEVITMILCVCLIAFCVMLYCRQKSMAFLLAINARQVSANKLPERFYIKTTQAISTVSTTFEPYHKIVKDNIPIDVSILFLLALLVLFILIYIFIRWSKNVKQNQTTVYLEIGNKTEKWVCKLFELPYPSNFYTFEIQRSLANLTLAQTIWGTRLTWAHGTKIKVTQLDHYVTIAQSVFIPFWNLNKVKRLLNGSHYSLLQVRGQKTDLKSLIVLENLIVTGMESANRVTGYQYSAAKSNALYPVIN